MDLFNDSIVFNQFKKIQLIKGDAVKTVPKFKKEHPELVVSLLLLQCGMYKPTITALKNFYPRMPKGSVIVFGGTNFPPIPGETLALEETLGITNIKLKRLNFSTRVSYIIKE